MGRNRSRKSAVDVDQTIADGTKKNLAGERFRVGRQSYGSDEIVAVYERRASASLAVTTARNALAAALKSEDDERASTAVFDRGFRSILQGMFGEVPETLAEFGLTPRKTGKKSIAVLQGSIAKSKATREARGTMGKRQREQITATTPAAPAPTAVPTPASAPTSAPASAPIAPTTASPPVPA